MSLLSPYSHGTLARPPPPHGTPGARIKDKEDDEEEDDDERGFQVGNARPPSHIDLLSTTPAPDLPTRSPLRSGFRARGQSESEGAIIDADSAVDETQREEQSNTASSHKVETRGRAGTRAVSQHPDDRPQTHAGKSDSDEHNGSGGKSKTNSSPTRIPQPKQPQPQPQPQPTLNATPTHAHVKAGAGVSIGGPIGMMRAPGVEERMAQAGDARDAQEQGLDFDQEQEQRTESDERQTNTSAFHAHGHGGEDEDDSYVDASADFAVPGEHPQPHPEPHGSTSTSTSTSNRDISNGNGNGVHEEHEVTGAVTGRGGGGKDKDKDKDKEEKRKSGGLISKMRRTLSRATNGSGSGNGRPVS